MDQLNDEFEIKISGLKCVFCKEETYLSIGIPYPNIPQDEVILCKDFTVPVCEECDSKYVEGREDEFVKEMQERFLKR